MLLGEAGHLLRAIGFAADHAILIGGMVPGLLVLDPGLGHPHVGTADLDLCLSVALVEGDTAEYERIETALKDIGYEMTDQSFRWRRNAGLRPAVEFFCPAGEDRPAGQLFRPVAKANPVAKHVMGSRLSALALSAGNARFLRGMQRRVPRDPPFRTLGYLGGNCELGTGSARLAVGALSMKPITAQSISTPTEP
jgi:hypothetical protein